MMNCIDVIENTFFFTPFFFKIYFQLCLPRRMQFVSLNLYNTKKQNRQANGNNNPTKSSFQTMRTIQLEFKGNKNGIHKI